MAGEDQSVEIIGGGLAGCEAAWQLAQRGIGVRLCEMKPLRRTPAQKTDDLAELVCSNSLRSNNPLNAVGLLKEEMLRLDSLIIQSAHRARVPAGDALAVDRKQFAEYVSTQINGHPLIERIEQEVHTLPDHPCIIATGPLTSDSLAEAIVQKTGQQRLYFYDALAPIVDAESLDRSVIFAASRYDKGEGADYLNCPLDKESYETFIETLLSSESAPLHAFEEPKYFEGCLPIEVMAARGPDTLRYGCMKPVGLTDPRTGRWPYAVVQLRKEDRHGQAYNLVGFQTKLKYGEQLKLLRSIPGLQQATFLRLGSIHRNTYLDSPQLLDANMALRGQPHIRFAGQITGVEGYVESAAHGLLTAINLAHQILEQGWKIPPIDTACGALYRHVLGEQKSAGGTHEPQNINWGLFPPTPPSVKKKEKKEYRLHRARTAFVQWGRSLDLELKTLDIDHATQAPASVPKNHPSTPIAETLV